ncbi:protein of unknown function [Cupriavidus neocaledonicus]|uniref:HTH lysR-type domain-containing protein n=1 Tax=Cupriavidus neocaledonicus TaxID=1040979 RepID=A0A375H6X8_9BURK|nr:protein of unknown function [Cupriavidus neocaledonicus]
MRRRSTCGAPRTLRWRCSARARPRLRAFSAWARVTRQWRERWAARQPPCATICGRPTPSSVLQARCRWHGWYAARPPKPERASIGLRVRNAVADASQATRVMICWEPLRRRGWRRTNVPGERAIRPTWDLYLRYVPITLSNMTPSRLRVASLDGLLAFEAAARYGTFERAAEALCVTGSAVAKRVAAVEQMLGVSTGGQRRKDAVLPTPARPYLQQVIGPLRMLAAVPLHRPRDRRRQRLRVCSPPTFARQIIAPGACLSDRRAAARAGFVPIPSHRIAYPPHLAGGLISEAARSAGAMLINGEG